MNGTQNNGKGTSQQDHVCEQCGEEVEIIGSEVCEYCLEREIDESFGREN